MVNIFDTSICAGFSLNPPIITTALDGGVVTTALPERFYQAAGDQSSWEKDTKCNIFL